MAEIFSWPHGQLRIAEGQLTERDLEPTRWNSRVSQRMVRAELAMAVRGSESEPRPMGHCHDLQTMDTQDDEEPHEPVRVKPWTVDYWLRVGGGAVAIVFVLAMAAAVLAPNLIFRR